MDRRDIERAEEIQERLDAEASAQQTSEAANYVRGIVGAAIGGVAGYFAFEWLLTQALYAVVLPGALLGLGCGALMKRQSLPMGIVCGVMGLFLGVTADWKHSVYPTDFGAYMQALPRFPSHIILIGLGALFAAWFGRGRDTAYKS